MKTYKVGVVGLSHGVNHARIVNDYLPNAELVMVCDLLEERLEGAAKALQCKNTTRHYADMVGNADIDVICVASSDYTHGKMVLAALDAGKHVMVETPMENRDMDLLWNIVRLTERKNLKLQFDVADRWLAESLTMKELIDEGKVGDPYYVICEYLQDIRQQGAGYLLDPRGFRMGYGEMPQEPVSAGAGLYALDTAMWFCGEPFTEVFAYGNRKNLPSRNIDDHDVAMFRSASGTIARVQCSKAARRPYKEIIKSVWGTRGTVECSGYLPTPKEDNTSVYACLTDAGAGAEAYPGDYEMEPVPMKEQQLPPGMTEEDVSRVGHEGVEVLSWLDLLASIDEDRLPAVDVYQGFRVGAGAIAVRRSKEENRPVAIPQIVARHEELKQRRPLPMADVSIEDLW